MRSPDLHIRIRIPRVDPVQRFVDHARLDFVLLGHFRVNLFEVADALTKVFLPEEEDDIVRLLQVRVNVGRVFFSALRKAELPFAGVEIRHHFRVRFAGGFDEDVLVAFHFAVKRIHRVQARLFGGRCRENQDHRDVQHPERDPRNTPEAVPEFAAAQLADAQEGQHDHQRQDRQNEALLPVGEPGVEGQEQEGRQEKHPVLSRRAEIADQRQDAEREQQNAEQDVEIHEVVRVRHVGRAFIHVVNDISDEFRERVAPDERVDRGLGGAEHHDRTEDQRPELVPLQHKEVIKSHADGVNRDLVAERNSHAQQQTGVEHRHFPVVADAEPHGPDEERHADDFHQVAHRQERHGPQQGKHPAGKHGGFFVRQALGDLVSVADHQQRQQRVQQAVDEHDRLRVRNADGLQEGNEQEVQPDIRKAVSVRLARRQPVVVIVAVGPRSGRFDDEVMVVVHPVTFGKEHGDQPHGKCEDQDGFEGGKVDVFETSEHTFVKNVAVKIR